MNNYYPAPTEVKANDMVTAGTGFNVENPLDTAWFAADWAKKHPQTAGTTAKIASGGYLDGLLAQPTSFEDLLRTLRN